MIKHLALPLLAGLIYGSTPAWARDYTSMYAPETLQRAHAVYAPNIQAALYEEIAAYLNAHERSTLARTRLLQPWDRQVDPFEFASHPRSGVILVPTFSIKFFDELAIATAWFEHKGCRKEAIFDYVTAMDFSPLALAAPLDELGVPSDAYRRSDYVDDVSQKILKSAVAFILLHELAHVHLQHRHYDAISSDQAQRQEIEADAFAISILRRMRLPPLGMTVWFMAVSKTDPVRPEAVQRTHPLSGQRLLAIADALSNRPSDFIEFANRGRITPDHIRSLAAELSQIATGLSDPDLLSFLKLRGRLTTRELFAKACDSAAYDRYWQRRFKAATGAPSHE